MGVENVLAADIVGRESGLLRDCRWAARGFSASIPARPGPVFACIRAEDVAITRQMDQVSSARNRLAGRVRSVIPEGPLARVELDCGFPLVAVVTAQSAARTGAARGRERVRGGQGDVGPPGGSQLPTIELMAKKESPVKTNAARILDAAGIHYELREYAVDEDDLSAPRVAEKIGMPPEQVFKTLVARGDRTGVLMACIPANTELDLKALAAASGNKKVELVAVKEVLGLTGYIRGGVSPIGTRKPYPFYLDETAILWDVISVSAGVRGCQMLLAPDDLTRVLDARSCAIANS